MTITLVTLLLAAIGFVWGRLRSDMVALIALMILTLSGVITTQEALLGFSNPIVVMMVGLFVVGGAIFKTGLAKVIGARLLKLAGDSQIKLFLLVIAGTALIGAFVSNTGTVALMLPIVVSMTAASGTSPSRFLMPLAFASSLGGMMTLIGTPPNLVISEVWEEYSHQPMSFFTFFPAGAICLLIGTLLLIPLSKWFLSGKGTKGDRTGDSQKSIADLVKEYGLEKALYRVTIPATSPLVGKTLHELNLRSTFSIDVLEIRKGERGLGLLKKITQHAGDPDTPISAGETLYVRGDLDNVSHFAGTYKLKVDFSEEHGLEFYDVGIAEIMPLPQASVLNRRIADLGLRAQFGLNVLGIRRKNTIISTSLGDMVVKPHDVLLVQGTWSDIARLNEGNKQWIVLGQPLKEAAKVTLDYKAPLAALIMAAMVVALVLDLVPAVVCVLTAAVLMVLTGCFRNVDEAYNTINWESVVLIAAMMPMSFALEKTGVSELVSRSLVETLGHYGPLILLGGIYFTTSIMTLFISNTATAVLMAPIALESAIAFGVNPLPFLFAVTFGASLCFASPFSTPPNALVMPAGQYKFIDYVKVGVPLQLILGVVMVCILPLLFPF